MKGKLELNPFYITGIFAKNKNQNLASILNNIWLFIQKKISVYLNQTNAQVTIHDCKFNP
jgi:hypothetical protein